MSWQQIEGQWRQFVGEARKRWGKLSDSDLEQCQGNRELLVGKLQQLYGMSADLAGEEIASIEHRISDSRKGAERQYGAC